MAPSKTDNGSIEEDLLSDAPPPYALEESSLVPLKDASAFENEAWAMAKANFNKNKEHKEDRVQKFLKLYTTESAVQSICEDGKKNKSAQYGKIMGKILDKIQLFKAAGDIAVKAAPESVGLAWMGISLCLGAVQDDYQTLQVIGSACADIVGIMLTSRLLVRMFSESRGPEKLREIEDKVLEEAPNLYGKILEFSYQAWKHVEENAAKRMLEGILKKNKDDFQGKINGVKAADAKLREYASLANQALMRVNQEGMKNDLGEIRKILTKSAASSNEWARQLESQREEIDKLRKRTPMQVAQETYDKQRKQLETRLDQATLQNMQEKRLKLRIQGTCQWIFDETKTPEYAAWRGSDDDEMLLILGDGNMGKSILVSSVIEQLRQDKDALTIMFFCKKGEDNAQLTDLICKNIINALYAYAGEASLDALDKCNETVKSYLLKFEKAKDAKGEKVVEELENTSSFEDAFRKIATTLQKRVYLVVDALDECSDRKERGMIDRLRRLSRTDLDSQARPSQPLSGAVTTRGPSIKVFASSRPETDVIGGIAGRVHHIYMAKHVSADISDIVTAKLAGIHDLSATERAQAHEAIVAKAGTIIGYINSAIAIFEKPWQRPLADHLEKLPKDLLDMNASIFSRIDPSYVGLLRTCLIWTLLGSGTQKIRVEEIAEAYSRVYLQNDEKQEREPMSAATAEFYRDVLLRAGYDFLEIDAVTREISLIKPAIVHNSFIRETEDVPEPLEEVSCKTCQLNVIRGARLTFTERQGHFEIARTIYQHLNSPLFQRLYTPGSSEPENEGGAGEGKSGEEVENGDKQVASSDSPGVVEIAPASLPLPTQASDLPESEVQQIDTLNMEGLRHEASSSEEAATIIVTSNQTEPDTAKNDEIKTTQAIDTIDTNTIEDGESVPPDQMETSEENAPASQDPDDDDVDSDADSDFEDDALDDPDDYAADTETTKPRYELSGCVYHLQQLEKLWEGYDKPEGWDDLWESAINFLESSAFRRHLIAQEVPFGNLSYYSATTLHCAVEAGLVEVVRRLLARGTDVQNNSDAGYRALHYAGWQEQEELQYKLCKMLFEHNAKPGKLEKDEDYSMSPFMLMCYFAPTLRTTMLFLEHDADPRELSYDGATCLHMVALRSNQVEVVRLLIEKGADVNAEDDDGETPLHKLVRREDCTMEMLNTFLDANADVNRDDKKSQQPLAEASHTKRVEVIRSLLEHKADVHDKDNDGLTALHQAARWSSLEVVDLLLEYGSDASLADNKGRTPFWWAAAGANLEIMKRLHEVLRSEHAEVLDMPDTFGRTPLRKACASGNLDAAKFLFELQGSDKSMSVNAQDSRLRRTALHAAARKGIPEVVDLLLNHHADPKLADKYGKTPLQLAYHEWSMLHDKQVSNERYTATISQLIKVDRGAAVADQELLHVAAIKGSIPILKSLLRSDFDVPGANPNVPDEHGWTAVDHARQYGRIEAERLLQSRDGVFGQRPSRWLPNKMNKMLVSDDGTEVWQAPWVMNKRYNKQYETLFSEHPIPSGSQKYYYEITIEAIPATPNDNPIIAIGVGHYGLTKLTKRPWLPGHPTHSRTDNMWGYHGDDGYCAASLGTSPASPRYLETYGPNDTVGCAIDFAANRLFFTKNGKMLSERVFNDVKGRLHCALGMREPAKVKTNFNGPFMWAPGNSETWEGFEGYPDEQKAADVEKEGSKADEELVER